MRTEVLGLSDDEIEMLKNIANRDRESTNDKKRYRMIGSFLNAIDRYTYDGLAQYGIFDLNSTYKEESSPKMIYNAFSMRVSSKALEDMNIIVDDEFACKPKDQRTPEIVFIREEYEVVLTRLSHLKFNNFIEFCIRKSNHGRKRKLKDALLADAILSIHFGNDINLVTQE